ncbi:metallophosphoesterase family protein [Mycolicibacterium poriferae]|uniref:metallophosphoesterase family protein n=1 Tax=Mycolicibacterium poriferae TaxID=39694 RepID=UPI000C962D43|nr:metallophosphatase [Ahrensia sp.]|tara:strand:+ start:7292 stop:8200 length:909 start_codon:yes stop_codon:yes gene_type:complete
MSYKLAHISDIHMSPLPGVRSIDLLSKRITGYINWKRNRAAHMDSDTLVRLVNAMKAGTPDHIAVTGDLTNLALDAEIANAALWLRSLGADSDVSVVPGNHDAYVPGALSKAAAAWRDNMTTEAPDTPVTSNGFPFLRRRGPLAVIGVNSAVATAPFFASGIFSRRQANGLADLLRKADDDKLFRVVLIHHPPVRNAATPQKRLYGIRLFQSVIREHGAELVLHGHTHLPQRHEIAGPDGAVVPVIGVPAAGETPGGRKPAAAFNLFTVEGEKGCWRCRLEEMSLTGKIGGVSVTDCRELYG